MGVVLVYHRIAELSPDSHALCTPPEVFRAQMAYLRERCTPIALEDLAALACSRELPDRAVAVTVDDGYLDALTTASPLLLQYGVPATFFVNSDRLEDAHERWWDILERALLCRTPLPSSLSIPVGPQLLCAPTSTMAERVAALNALNNAAWPLDPTARRRLAAGVLAWSGASECPRDSHRVLTASELGTLAGRPGHTVGAHTVNHLALTCHDSGTRRREIADDKAALESVVGRRVNLFSYPCTASMMPIPSPSCATPVFAQPSRSSLASSALRHTACFCPGSKSAAPTIARSRSESTGCLPPRHWCAANLARR